MAKKDEDPLDEIFDAIISTYKDCGTAVDLDNPEAYNVIEFRKSGCLAFDWIAANHNPKGGVPRGKIIEIFGPEGGGKTTLCNCIAAATQGYKKKNSVLYVDFENKYNWEYAQDLGVEKDKLRLFSPEGKNRGEAGCKALTLVPSSKVYGLSVCDSMTAIISKEELAGELGDANIGKKAILQSRTINKIAAASSQDSATSIFINQVRVVIGNAYGLSEDTTGARALKFFAVLRVEVRGAAKILDERDNVIGQTIKMKAVKNQASRPFMKTEIDMLFGIGYDNTKWCVEKAIELGVIIKQKKKKLVYNFNQDFYQSDEVDLTLPQLTEMFYDKKALETLYAACVAYNNLEYKKLCDARKSKRERVLAVEEAESSEPEI